MGLLVLSYPEISDKDYQFIQEFRKKHDRYYKLFNPHFTFVFPVYNVKEEDFTKHIKKTAVNFSPVDFTLNCAITIKDYFSEYRDVLLVPDEGNSEIIKMHDTLYKDILITSLRIDIPFIPHMTIGNDVDHFYSIDLANELNKEGFSIKGKIKELSIIRYEENKVENIENISLS